MKYSYYTLTGTIGEPVPDDGVSFATEKDALDCAISFWESSYSNIRFSKKWITNIEFLTQVGDQANILATVIGPTNEKLNVCIGFVFRSY